MGLFDKLFKKSSIEMTEPNYKHNVYDSEISQYSPLPRFYFIKGIKYDIDSPESVSSIPMCETHFKINDDDWGIDTILREHVNRYYSHIPNDLKPACYSKIAELKNNGFYVESNAEKTARLHQAEHKKVIEDKLKSISLEDMKKFNLQFKLQEPFYDNKMSIILINEDDQKQVINDMHSLEDYVQEACSYANINVLKLPIDELIFEPQKLDVGKPSERSVYYTFFQCEPYTKTEKLSKYPLILHYATNAIEPFSFERNCFGRIYYMQDGSIGKCILTFWIRGFMYNIELKRKGLSLIVGKVETSNNGAKEILYKSL